MVHKLETDESVDAQVAYLFNIEIYMNSTWQKYIIYIYLHIYMYINTCKPMCASKVLFYIEMCQHLVIGGMQSGSGGCNAFTLFRCQCLWCFFLF